jgi:L-aspartate oxidase
MPRPLLSEALRGHGALLRDTTGERFVDELLPRDEVSRAMTARMLDLGVDHCWLDATGLEAFDDRFPTIAAALAEAGLDPTTDWLPIAPAAHYLCGGVVTDIDGATTLPGLWAAGEVACSGVHGANRLASNSLSECFVFGRRAALAGLDEPEPELVTEVAEAEPVAPPPTRETRKAVWRLAGLERTAEGLAELLEDPHPLARLVAACALAREETRGAHARAEFPEPDAALDGRHTVLSARSGTPSFAAWL